MSAAPSAPSGREGLELVREGKELDGQAPGDEGDEMERDAGDEHPSPHSREQRDHESGCIHGKRGIQGRSGEVGRGYEIGDGIGHPGA
jgi:hypothetical protein